MQIVVNNTDESLHIVLKHTDEPMEVVIKKTDKPSEIAALKVQLANAQQELMAMNNNMIDVQKVINDTDKLSSE